MSATISELQARTFAVNCDNGWHQSNPVTHGPDKMIATLALIHSEVSEAIEEIRAGNYPRTEYYSINGQRVAPCSHGGDHDGADWCTGYGPRSATWTGVAAKPEGVPSELADIVIRCLDFAATYGIDLAAVIDLKLAYNSTRPHRHGGKAI